MIRVLVTINSLVAAGAETLILQLCRALPHEGVMPVVASLLGPGPLSPFFEQQGTPVANLSREGERPGPRSMWRLLTALRRERIDIVHTHLVYAGIMGKVAAKMVGLPVVVTRHYTTDPREHTVLFRLEDILTTRLADRVVALTGIMRDILVAQGLAERGRICVHHNAIDLTAYGSVQHLRGPRSDPGEFLIGTVGRLERQKAQEVFLATMRLVHEARPSARGVIIGEGSRRPELEEMCRRLGLDGVVRFVGTVPSGEVRSWLGRLDVFSLSSDWEGLPMVLIEAKACGCPIVATAVGGVPEVVRDGIDGTLVPPRNPRAMADAIISLLDHPEVGRSLGENARAHAFEHFDIARLARQTAEMYRQVLGERRRR